MKFEKNWKKENVTNFKFTSINLFMAWTRMERDKHKAGMDLAGVEE